MRYLPTDSLYKFMAIAGIIIIIFSFYYPLNLIKKLEIDSIDANNEEVALRADIDFFRRRAEDITEIIDNTTAERKGQFKHNPDKLELRYSQEEIKALLSKLKEDERNIKVAGAKLSNSLEKTKLLLNDIKTLSILMVVSIIIGIILTFMGFYLWYARIQKFMDIKLKEIITLESSPNDSTEDV